MLNRVAIHMAYIGCVFVFILNIIASILSLTMTMTGSSDVQSTTTTITTGCRDENGEFTPWFILYKLPRLEHSTDPYFKVGLGYYYFVPNSNDDWIKSDKSINDSNSFVGWTLENFYKKDDNNLAYVLYNDHVPQKPKTLNRGHTKGLLVTNSRNGFWLAHSVPQFPVLSKKYEYQAEETIRGQIFLCLSLNASQIESIADILEQIQPDIFIHSIPESMSSIFPKLKMLIDDCGMKIQKLSPKSPIHYNIYQLETYFLKLNIYAKSPEFEVEVYSDWIAPSLKTNLAVQSWLGKPDRLPSNCTPPYLIYNVNISGIDEHKFPSSLDHSKWSVSLDSTKPWTCIGDLNRRKYQASRGGAVICIMDKQIWRAFRRVVVQIEECVLE